MLEMNRPGLFYDPKRGRYRVRFYIRSKCVFLEYHDNPVDAEAAYERGRQRREKLRSRADRPIATIADQIQALSTGLL